jgi:hypothetical protein
MSNLLGKYLGYFTTNNKQYKYHNLAKCQNDVEEVIDRSEKIEHRKKI